MNDSIKLFSELFSLSGCFWIIFYLFSNFAIKGFIVKRYTRETDLSNTLFFRKYATFINGLPDFLSAGFYATHLLIFVWGWKIVQYFNEKRTNIPYFMDIKDPEYGTSHFTKREIAKAKRVLISGIIFFMHVIMYFLLICIHPEAFN